MSARQHASPSKARHTARAATQQPGHTACYERAAACGARHATLCSTMLGSGPSLTLVHSMPLDSTCTKRRLQQQSLGIQAPARHERPAQHFPMAAAASSMAVSAMPAWSSSASTSTHQHYWHLSAKFSTEQSFPVQRAHVVQEQTSAHNCATHGDDAPSCSSSSNTAAQHMIT